MFRGDFFGPLEAKDWTERFASQANPEAMQRSGASIVVASLYAHPLFTWSLKDSIRRQIQLARKFVLRNPDWVIATEPSQAEFALERGKHVLILALEGASGILETEEDLKEFIDDGAIRIVGPLHLTDDEFGAVAFLRGWRVLSDPLAWLKQLMSPEYGEGVRINHGGLSERGQWLVEKLLARHIWIDLAHASDHSAAAIMPMLEAAHQPLLFTHTVLRKFHGAERGISEAALARVARSGGIIGVMPSAEMLEGAPDLPSCPGPLGRLVREYATLTERVGTESVMMGSDYNGGLPHLPPTAACATGTSLDTQGLWNIGQSSELWSALRKAGAPVPLAFSKSSARFVGAWKKVFGQ